MTNRKLFLGAILGFAMVIFASQVTAFPGNFLNYAILTFPPKYLADIPLNQRTELLKELSEPTDDCRLDYEHGYLTWHSEITDVSHSCAFYLKVLPGDTAIFVHMKKPYAGRKPSAKDTRVVSLVDGTTWKDITERVFPKGIDRTSYFNPLRNSLDVEVAPWVKRQGINLYEPGQCSILLRWNGSKFDEITIKTRDTTNGY